MILAHVDNKQGPDIFFRLDELHAGTQFEGCVPHSSSRMRVDPQTAGSEMIGGGPESTFNSGAGPET